MKTYFEETREKAMARIAELGCTDFFIVQPSHSTLELRSQLEHVQGKALVLYDLDNWRMVNLAALLDGLDRHEKPTHLIVSWAHPPKTSSSVVARQRLLQALGELEKLWEPRNEN